MSSYMSLLGLYEKNPETFSFHLNQLSEPGATRLFWTKLSEKRFDAPSILCKHTCYVIKHQDSSPSLTWLFTQALANWPDKERARAAVTFYKDMDPLYFLSVLDSLLKEPEPSPFTFHLISYLFMLENRKEFSLVFKEFLLILAKVPLATAQKVIRESRKSLSEGKFLELVDLYWKDLPLEAQCRLIPQIPIRFTLEKVPKADLKSLASWLHVLMEALIYPETRREYFVRFLRELPICLRVSDVVRLLTPIKGSPALSHFLSDLDSYQFNSLCTLRADALTNFLYAVDFVMPEEALLVYEFFKNNSSQWVLFSQETLIEIYDEDSYEISPLGFIRQIQCAIEHHMEEGSLLDPYIRRIENAPPVLFLLIAAQARHFEWILNIAPYLEEKALSYLALCLPKTSACLLFERLWDKSRADKALIYFKNAPYDVQEALIDKPLTWFNEKDQQAKKAAGALKRAEKTSEYYPVLYTHLQEALATRREIDGPFARQFTLYAKEERFPAPLREKITLIQNIIERARSKNLKWSQKGGMIQKIYALEPEEKEEAGPLNVPNYILEALNRRVLNASGLSAASELPLYGLSSEEDFQLLGLTKEYQLKLDKIQMDINRLMDNEPNPEVAPLWETIRESSAIDLTEYAAALMILLNIRTERALELTEEVELKHKLAQIHTKIKSLPGVTSEELGRFEALHDNIYPVASTILALISFIKDNSFENRLFRYLSQSSLRAIWEEMQNSGIKSLKDLPDKENYDLFRFKDSTKEAAQAACHPI